MTQIKEEFVKEKSKQKTFIENKDMIWNWSNGVKKNILMLHASFLL